MPVVISDASVLICLGAIQQLHLLRDFYQEIVVPDAVWTEVTVAAASRAGAKEAIQARQEAWLKVQTPANRPLVISLHTVLGAGESEAIALATELHASLLLIDENDGRRQAKALGLAVTGTLGVLLRARQTGKLSALKPVLNTLMQQHNFRLSHILYEQVLRQAGETL
jgi:uncharacterized protein